MLCSTTRLILHWSSLLDELGASDPSVGFSLTTCARQNLPNRGRRVEGLVLKSLDSAVTIDQPTILEMQTIPSDKAEIATPELVRNWPYIC